MPDSSGELPFRFHWLFLRDALADFKLQLAGLFVCVDDYVVAVQHLAVFDYFPARRLGYRVTIKGDRPF